VRLVSILLIAAPLFSQGIVSGNAPSLPRPKFSGLPFPVTFTDIAASAGLTMSHVSGSPERKRYIIEANGSGVAFLDYDEDGRLDVFLLNGSRLEPPPPSTSRLYRNTGSGKFVDVTTRAGLDRAGWGNGVCGGDFDNDGRLDLYLTYWGPNSLYRSQGDGSFTDIASRAGVAGPAGDWSTGCTFLDYDRDGLLDLFVAGYAGFDPKKTPLPGQFPFCFFKGAPVFCGPRGLPHGSLTLYRNTGEGKFQDVSLETGIRKATACYAFTAVAADLNHDGWTDLYVACDSTPSLYFRNNRGRDFSELATQAGIAYNEHGAEQAGMGLAIADYNNDGWLDITKTNFIRDYPNLYLNLGKGFFEDRAASSGLAINPHYVLWGAGLEDFDNDGWRDLFQVAGHVYPELQKIEPYSNPRLLYRNLRNGKFEDVSHLAGPGVAALHSSRGAAFGDFDNDGDVDVLVMNMHQPPSLLRNDLTSSNNWIKVKLEGPAIGATVIVHAGGLRQSAPALSQSSFLSLNDRRLHFGLGEAKAVDRFTVRWSSGEEEEFPGMEANRLVLLVHGSRQSKASPLPR